MTFRELRHLPPDNPYTLGFKWLRWESLALAVIGVAVGVAMTFEGASNFNSPVWRGVTTLMPIEAWGISFLLISAWVLVILAMSRIPLWGLVFGAVGGSALGTLLLLGGQHPDVSSVPGLFSLGLTTWSAMVVAKNIDLRDELKRQGTREKRQQRLGDLDDQMHKEQAARESSNDA